MPYKDPEAKRRWRQDNKVANGIKLAEWKKNNPSAQRSYGKKQADKQREANLVMRLFREAIDRRISASIEQENSSVRYRRTLRTRAIQFLGGRCEWCGLDEFACLEIDHKTPLKRRTNGHANHDASGFCRKIIDGTETNAQLLCANCHRLKTRMDREFEVVADIDAFDPYRDLNV